MHMFINSAASSLRHITPEQLLRLGMRQVVYLRSGMRDGEQAFAVYGADGISLVRGRHRRYSGGDGRRIRGLDFVTVH